ncbi:MAG: DsbA family oxidoreductase [Sphingomonadales bacterium]|nr:DsbA family oxidoreductase [Sphingomonadales bacterium]MDE2567407.1 DsbA family oxidoreductase [Sphingomonadales bacterium]
MTATPAKVTIDVWSDVMCPWCVIGTRQLAKALDELEGEIEAEIRFRPFELNPDMPPEGEEQAAHIQRKYGRSAAESAGVRDRLKGFGERVGYSFSWQGEGEAPPAMIWNTFLAHKLLYWALRVGGPEAQGKLKRAMFDAHFQQRRNMADPEVLVDIAVGVGLPKLGAAQTLLEQSIGNSVRHEEAMAWDMNITGVPAMVVNGKAMIPGAQEPEVYVNVLRRVVAREAAQA